MALHDKILKTLRGRINEHNEDWARLLRNLTNPTSGGMRPPVEERAERIVKLGQEIRVLEDAYTTVKAEVRRWKVSGHTKFVVMVGPNEPEVLAADELPEVLSTFTLDEVSLWVRSETGGLDLVTVEPTGSWRDDSFAYFTGDLRVVGDSGRTIGSTSWSRKF